VFKNLLKPRQGACFRLKPSQIQLFDDPLQNGICNYEFIKNAEERYGNISLTWHHIGMCRLLFKQLTEKCEANPTLQVRVIGDFHRAQRKYGMTNGVPKDKPMK